MKTEIKVKGGVFSVDDIYEAKRIRSAYGDPLGAEPAWIRYIDEIEDNPHFGLTLNSGGMLIGYLLAEHVNDNVFRLDEICLAREYCGLGLGRYLVEGLTKCVKQDEPLTFFARPPHGNLSAREFLRHMGFEDDDEEMVLFR